MQFQLWAMLFRQDLSRNCQNTKYGWNPYGVIITPEMELADNTYLDGEGESALKALKGRIPRQLNQERYGRHHSCVCRSFEGVVRELFGVPFNT